MPAIFKSTSKLFGRQGYSDIKHWLDFSSIFFEISRFRGLVRLSLKIFSLIPRKASARFNRIQAWQWDASAGASASHGWSKAQEMKSHIWDLAKYIKPSSIKTLTDVMGWPVGKIVTTDNRVTTGTELSHKTRTPYTLVLFARMMLISLLKIKQNRIMRIYRTEICNQPNESEALPIYCPVLISCDIKSLPWYGYDVMVTWSNLDTVNN